MGAEDCFWDEDPLPVDEDKIQLVPIRQRRGRHVYADDVHQRRRLQANRDRFWCTYCGKHWPRGGKKEGFVKSAALNHVAACYEIFLWKLGYVLGPYVRNEQTVKPKSEATAYQRRTMLQLIAKRKRQGNDVRLNV